MKSYFQLWAQMVDLDSFGQFWTVLVYPETRVIQRLEGISERRDSNAPTQDGCIGA